MVAKFGLKDLSSERRDGAKVEIVAALDRLVRSSIKTGLNLTETFTVNDVEISIGVEIKKHRLKKSLYVWVRDPHGQALDDMSATELATMLPGNLTCIYNSKRKAWLLTDIPKTKR